MKKPLFITIICSLIFATCTEPPATTSAIKEAKIILNLPGCSDSVAIIDMFDFNKMNFITKTEKNNGTFELLAALSQDVAYLIQVGEIKIPFVYDGKDMIFTGNCSDLGSIEVEGSSNTRSLLGFINKVEYINGIIGSQKAIYDSVLINNNEDSVIKLAKQILDQRYVELNQYIKSYIDSVHHFQLALYALDYLNPTTELSFFEKFTKNINKRFPKNTIADSFKTMFMSNIEKINQTEVKVGDMAPDFTLQDLNGKSVSLSESNGKYVFLDFWASFCSPCRTESKNKIKIAREFSDHNFQMISVSLDQNESKWKNAIVKDSMNWIHLIEPLSWDSRLNEMYNLDKIPTNYLIDPTGKIIAKNLSLEELHERLDELWVIKTDPEEVTSK